MQRVYTYTKRINVDMVDAFCRLQKEFTDQFVYYDKQSDFKNMGMGRCIALGSPEEIDTEFQGEVAYEPILFTFRRFDAANETDADPLFQAFPNLAFMLPEVVLFSRAGETYLQINSLGPVYPGRVARFVKMAEAATPRTRRTISYSITPDRYEDWEREVTGALNAIRAGRVDKVVLSRQLKLEAKEVFSSKDLLINLIDGTARGVVYMYRYGDVCFIGCTPELLVRKTGADIESMCLAGTCPAGQNEDERAQYARELLADEKNRGEHAFVVNFVRQVVSRVCHAVDIPETPEIKSLVHVQHLYTPVHARLMSGRTLWELASQLQPTPALSGMPVGEALMLIREIEPYNRGFFGGVAGCVDASGDGACSVAIRGGVFDGEIGYVYAGCGIVEMSDPRAEYDEIDLKLQTICSAFDGGR